MDADPAMEIAPLETTSPTMFKMPPDVVVIALPGMPPHPAWLKAAIVGVYRRLFTPAEAAAVSWGADPLVRMRANSSTSERVALIVNWTPAAPSEVTAWVRTV